MFKNQKGFTLLESVVALGFISVLGLVCGCVWVACHFITKAW